MLSVKKRVKYDPDAMKRAIELVHNGVAKKRAASMCGVPRTTLLDKLYGRVPVDPTKPGPKTVLTSAEEDVLVHYISLMAEVGYPVGRQELCNEVKKVLDKDDRQTPFKNNLPGKDWFRAFIQRHPEVAERKPQALGRQRAGVTSDMVDSWFKGVTTYLKKEVDGWEDMLRDPRRLFNADESGFPLCITSKRVLANSGAKNVYQVVNGSKVQITVMACFNANGSYMAPMVVYPGQRFRNVEIDQFPSALYGHSEKGWMDTDLFVEFLRHFSSFVKANGIPLPVLLFVDGHSTHMSLDAAEFCHDNDIVLYCLLPNATHLMQPCDISLFGPLKTAWRNEVKAWQMKNVGETITKANFPGVFKKAWDIVTTVHIASNGFKRSGLFPFSSREVDLTKLGPSKLAATSSSEVKPSQSACATVSSTSANVDDDTSSEESQNRPPNPSDQTTQIRPSLSTSNHEVPLTVSKSITQLNIPPSKPKDPKYVSPAFNALTVPQPKTKSKTSQVLRAKMPKAISGYDALKLLKEKHDQKIEEEAKKVERKRMRELKKIEREVDREKKIKEREEKKKERELKKAIAAQNKQKKRKHGESDSEGSCSEAQVDDSESGEEEFTTRMCARCDTESDQAGVVCCLCDRFWHLACTGADVCESEDFFCDLCCTE